MFSDFTKVFDTVGHSVLLEKLDNIFGIRGLSFKVFQSYLTNRYQCTKINNNEWKLSKVMCGIPQGSSRGFLLFLLYINDLPLVSSFV